MRHCRTWPRRRAPLVSATMSDVPGRPGRGGAPPARGLAAPAARALCACIVLAAVGHGCLWRSYDEVMRVHLEVLSGLADKAMVNAEAGQRPTSNDVTELTYPLQRARQFAHQYRGYAERESYQLFVAALDRYQALVETIDAARGDAARWAAERPRLAAAYQAWREAAEQARDRAERRNVEAKRPGQKYETPVAAADLPPRG